MRAGTGRERDRRGNDRAGRVEPHYIGDSESVSVLS
jgi:hypothetical protein